LSTAGIVCAAQDQPILQKLADLEKLQGKFTFISRKGKHSGDCLDKYPKDQYTLEAPFVKFKVEDLF